MQRVSIIFIDINGNEQTLVLNDLVAFKETFLSARSELQFVVQDVISNEDLQSVMTSTGLQKIILEKSNADGSVNISEFTTYPIFEKITQDFKVEKTLTTFAAMYVYNR